MSVPIRFDQLQPDGQARVRANLAKMQAQKAPDADMETYLRDVEHLAPAGSSTSQSTLQRAGTAISNFGREVMDPHRSVLLDAAKSVGQSAFDAFAAPVIGEVPSSDLAMIHGTDVPVTAKTPNAITQRRQLEAGAQTVTNAALPSIASGVTTRLGGGVLAKFVGSSAAGASAGAVNTPDDPIAGAIAGAVLAPALHAMGNGVVGAVRAAGPVASAVRDIAPRPTVSTRFTEGVNDRAARLNTQALQRSPTFTNDLANVAGSDKPLAPVDANVQALRTARGLKTASPVAEQVLQSALNDRADAAAQRVIDHAKDLTGIKRGSGYETHQKLIENTTQQGNAAYGKVWETEGDMPLADSPELADILRRPAMQKALPVAADLRQNLGEAAPTPGRPASIPPEQWAMLQSAAQRQGVTLPDAGSGYTLQDLHSAQQILRDRFTALKRAGKNDQARGPAATRKALLDVMDRHSTDYANARSQFADNKALENASSAGKEHWTSDPDETAAALKEMTPGEQSVYRDQAFNKWAIAVENGPTNVGKNKPLMVQRLHQLFPDDESFGKFQEGLRQEALMHRSSQFVQTGSNTADKVSDMADMGGVTLPDLLGAAAGHGQFRFLKKVGGAIVNQRTALTADAVNAERARLLVAGAGGDASARAAALAKMGITPLQLPAGRP